MTSALRGILLPAVLWFAVAASAQETRGVIFGRVSDPTNSAVVGASVVVTNTGTNVSNSLTTNETGYYEANFLIAGNYQVVSESAGFKRSIRPGIVLSVGSRVEINVVLELGEVTETVSVNAEAPLVDTSSPSGSSFTLETRGITDLPTFNNSPMMMVKFAPGMQGPPTRTYNGLNGLSGSATTEAISGVGGNDWSMDGATSMGANYTSSWLPFSTAIQEFKVETSQFDASVGHGTGSVISIMTKGGTNAYHGDLTYQTWQAVLNSADWAIRQNYYRSIAAAEAAGNTALANQIRDTRIQPSTHNHSFGGTVGGPAIHDKLFFFVSFDGFTDRKLRRGSPNVTVPTMLNRQGDFSDLAQVGPRYQLYDPLSVAPDPARAGHYVRTPIVNNVLPKSQIINPAYGTYVAFLPTPNNPPASATQEPLNNYVAAEPLNWWQYTLTNRIDYQHSEKNRIFGRWTLSKLKEDANDWTYSTVRKLMSAGNHRNVRNATLDWVFTPSPTVIIDTVFSGNDFEQWNGSWSIPESSALTYKPSDVGLPAYMDQKAGDNPSLPIMTWSGYVRGTEGIGRVVGAFTHYQTASVKTGLTHIRGSHTLKTGIDARVHSSFGGNPGAASGNFSFANDYTRREDDTLTPTGTLGFSWAAFMMGLPSEATVDTNDNYAITSPYYGLFFSDNWRVSSKLTLNLGVRLDYEFGRQERYNRLIGFFDPDVSLPISGLAQAAYATKPVPELAAADFVVKGGSVYPGVDGRGRKVDSNEWMVMPRFGFAYQLNPRTVLRGGYGIAMDRQDALNTSPDQFGFSRATINPVTNNFGIDWLSGNPGAGVSPLTDPFPVRSDGTRFDQPVGNTLGAMARAGLGWSFGGFDNPQRARTHRWRLELQREIGGSMMVSAAYSGVYADRVNVTRKLDALPDQHWAGGQARDNAVASNLNQNVANPYSINNFAELKTSSPAVYQAMSSIPFFTSPTIRKANLLRPFSQLNGLNQLRVPDGEVKAHAMEFVLKRRLTNGLMLQANYTALRQRDRDFYYDEFDPLPSWRLSNNGTPHRFAFVGIYELPFGRTKPWLQRGIGNALLGGWQVAWTYEWQPGPYLDFGNLFYTGDLNDIALNKSERTLDRWFNTDGFERAASKQPAAFHRRVFPTRVSNAKADGLKRLDGNIQRNFRLSEGLTFQLKADAINLINRTQFAAPNLNPTSTDFGRVTANSASTARFILLQARLTF